MRYRRLGYILIWIVILLTFTRLAWADVVAKKDKEARRFYNQGNIDEALSKWRDAQTDAPDKKELHYNIGNALHLQKKYEEAIAEYEKSIDSKDAELQARSYYNMGNTHYRMGKLLEAIEDYKRCLDINPEDEDAKYNIEFIREKIKENLQKEETSQKQIKQQKEIGQEAGSQEQKTQGSQESEQGQQPEQGQQLEQKEGEAKQEEATETKESEQQGSKEGQEQKEGEEKGLEEDQSKSQEAEGQMSREDAIRLLDALKNDEVDLQKELRRQPIEGEYRVEKDW